MTARKPQEQETEGLATLGFTDHPDQEPEALDMDLQDWEANDDGEDLSKEARISEAPVDLDEALDEPILDDDEDGS